MLMLYDHFTFDTIAGKYNYVGLFVTYYIIYVVTYLLQMLATGYICLIL